MSGFFMECSNHYNVVQEDMWPKISAHSAAIRCNRSVDQQFGKRFQNVWILHFSLVALSSLTHVCDRPGRRTDDGQCLLWPS